MVHNPTLFQWRSSVEDCGSTLKQHWLDATCLRKEYNGSGDSLVLGQRRRRLTDIEPAMGCNAGPTLNRNLVVGLHPLYPVHRRQVGRNGRRRYIWTCLPGSSQIISWTFRILAHEEDQCTDFLSIALKRASEFRYAFSSFYYYWRMWKIILWEDHC